MPILLLASPSQRKNLTSSPRRARSPPTPFLAAPPAQPVAQARQCGDRGFVLSCVDSGAEGESPAPRVAAACLGHRQKLTKAAPIPGTGPQGDSRGAGQQLSGTDGLGGGEDWSHQLSGPLTPLFLPSPIKQKRIQQHRPQSGGRAIAARQRTQLLWAPLGSSRLQLPGYGSRGGSGGDGCDRGSPVQSLPRTQHLELRTAPRLYSAVPASSVPP
ncbi:hypothetical protein R6Z07F_013036 [Ovis aries]